MSVTPDIDLILPCYNPAGGWDTVVLERLEMLRAQMPGVKIRAIVVNDGSVFEDADNSFSRLEMAAKDLLLISYPNNMGKGFAIRAGVQRSLAPVVVYTDIDFPYTIESMINIINPVLENISDVALAVRNETYYNQLPRVRRWISKFLRFVNHVFLRLYTSDTQGGLKAFNRTSSETFLKTRINRYLFDLEFVYLISRDRDLRIRTIEADLRDGITMSPVRLKIILGESWNFLKVLGKRR